MTDALLHSVNHGRSWHVEYDGEMIVVGSRDSEHALARVMLARGITGKVKVLDAETRKHRTTVDIEKAAPLTVSEENRGGLRIRKYCENPDIRPQTGEEPLAVPTLPVDSSEAA